PRVVGRAIGLAQNAILPRARPDFVARGIEHALVFGRNPDAQSARAGIKKTIALPRCDLPVQGAPRFAIRQDYRRFKDFFLVVENADALLQQFPQALAPLI